LTPITRSRLKLPGFWRGWIFGEPLQPLGDVTARRCENEEVVEIPVVEIDALILGMLEWISEQVFYQGGAKFLERPYPDFHAVGILPQE
jgi:hypothetical protein